MAVVVVAVGAEQRAVGKQPIVVGVAQHRVEEPGRTGTVGLEQQ